MIRNIYIVCLTVGGVYALLSFVLGPLLDFDFDFDFDFDLDVSLPIKPFTIMIFLAVFGGVGLIALNYLSPGWSLLPAVPVGIGVSALIYNLFYAKLKKYETRTPSEGDALMRRAEVVERIAPGATGKISFVINGNTLSGPAKVKGDGRGIKKGSKVFIVDYKDNTYFVAEDVEFTADGP